MYTKFNLSSVAIAVAAIAVTGFATIAGRKKDTLRKATAERATADLVTGETPEYIKYNRAHGIKTLETESAFNIPGNMTQWSATKPALFGIPTSEPIDFPIFTAPSTTFITANVAYNGGLTPTLKNANIMVQFLPTGVNTVKRVGSGSVYANGGGFYADGVYYTTY